MKRNNILIINNGLAGGGIQRASTSLANYFAGQGHRVTVVALYRQDHFFILHPDIEFVEPNFKRGNSRNKKLYLLKMMFYLKKTVKRISPDTILAYGEWTNPFVVLALMGLPYPLYLSDRMSPLLKLPAINEFLKGNVYKKANGIIAQTSFAKEVIAKRTGVKNIEVIPNPVNVMERISCEKKKRIITVGRLSPEKGHRYLIEAFAALKRFNWELSIVGDGAERANLKKLTEKLGVRERVLFHGHVQDFRQYLSEAEIFVLPSLKEGFPNALLEAMSVPLACVSSNCIAGPSDIIEHGRNGLLFEPGNVNELAGILEQLINNSNLRKEMAAEAFKVRDTFSFNKIAEKYLDFILGDQINNETSSN